MTKNKAFFHSLRAEMIYALLIATAVGLLLSYCTNQIGHLILEQTYMSSVAVSQRNKKLIANFRSYVQEHDIASVDREAIKQWCCDNGNTSVTIYRTDIVDNTNTEAGSIPAQNGSYPEFTSQMTPEEDRDIQQSIFFQTICPVEFGDGKYSVTLTDAFESEFSGIITDVSLLMFFAALLAGMLIYAGGVTKKVKQISAMAEQINNGAQNVAIKLSGKNEIASLAGSLDEMKDTLIDRLHSEQQAYQANQELITSMSHDLRNPMTSLMGYLDLLDNASMEMNPEERKKYLRICCDKAHQLKELSDEMFGYFLVFGNRLPEARLQSFPAQVFIEQMLGEQVALLSEEGYTVDFGLTEDIQGTLNADERLFMRLVDNLFSNIRKYADKSAPVIISATSDRLTLSLRFMNTIQRTNQAESSQIGLKTCEKIVRHMGGCLRIEKNEKTFSALINLPLSEKPTLPAKEDGQI